MNKFKVGDIVKGIYADYIRMKIIDYNNLYDRYEVQVIEDKVDPSQVGREIIYTGHSLNMFYEIDESVNQTYAAGQIFQNKTYPEIKAELVEIDHTNDAYILQYCTSGLKLGFSALELKNSWDLIGEKKNENPILEKSCTCSSRDLFIKGCRCGSIKSYRQEWK